MQANRKYRIRGTQNKHCRNIKGTKYTKTHTAHAKIYIQTHRCAMLTKDHTGLGSFQMCEYNIQNMKRATLVNLHRNKYNCK